MHALHIELRGLTASFRVPHMFKYHRSLPLPPYTSIVGMFGAAVGKGYATAQTLFELLGLKVGIAGSYSGTGHDTWRVFTTKNSENDVVERQFFYKPRYHVIFASKDEQAIEMCEKAFRYPYYPLSLGRPEDLANAIVYPRFEAEAVPVTSLQNTVITGTPTAQIKDSLLDPNDPTDHGPSTLLYRLPIRFRFPDGSSHYRVACEFRDFTFIGPHRIMLRDAVAGIRIGAKTGGPSVLEIPLLECK